MDGEGEAVIALKRQVWTSRLWTERK